MQSRRFDPAECPSGWQTGRKSETAHEHRYPRIPMLLYKSRVVAGFRDRWHGIASRVGIFSNDRMKIIGVLDILGGVVVHGVAGDRASYRPIASRRTAATDPLGVARALRDQLGLQEFYLADLDAIGGAKPAWRIYQQLKADQFQLWIDAGIRTPADGRRLLPHCEKLIAGLETIEGPENLEELMRAAADALLFSLDLRAGQPLGDLTRWKGTDPFAIASEVYSLGMRNLLVLDVARVGTGSGVGNEALLRQLRNAYPALHLIVGGGIRNREDLLQLEALGIDTVLMATALHFQDVQTW